MNVGQAAHLSGQMSGQAAQMNQVPGSGVGVGVGVGGADGLPQHQAMQEMAALSGTDQQFVMLRHTMREKIFECIGRKQSSAEWRRRLPELAKRLEEILYRKFPNKNDYYNMMKGPVEPQLQFAIKTLSAQNQQNQQNSQMSRQIASSSGYGTMIPTPGMAQGTSASSRIPYATDNNTLSSSGAGMVPQNTNMGTSMQGSMSNGYQHLNNSIPQNSATNNIQSTMGSAGVQRQLPHMIPTPGFSNQQNVPANPDYSNGTGYFNGESGVAPHMQHQKQFPSNQNSNQIQHIGGLSNSGIHSSMLDNSSGYGLSDGHMNGGIGVHGSNMQLTNRTMASEAYMNISPYGNSPKPIQQQFNQHPQQRIPTSVDMAGSGSFYPTGSTPVTTANSQSMNVANLQSRSRMNQMLVSNQLNIQSIPQQPQIKNEVLDQTEKVTTGGANGQPRLQLEPVDETAGLMAPATDQQFVMLRTAMREKIFEYIGRRPSSAEWRRRLPELAKRLEDILYTKFPNRNDYYNMTKGPVEPQLQCAIRTLAAQNQQNQRNPQVERQTPPSSSSNLDMNHDVSSEQFASPQADMQNNNADEHSRTE